MKTAVVAAAFTYVFDEEMVMWMRMYDADGYLICVAMVQPSIAYALCEYIADHIEEDEDEEDDMGEVMGNA